MVGLGLADRTHIRQGWPGPAGEGERAVTEQGYKHLLARIRLLSKAAWLSSTLTFTLQTGITESLHHGPLYLSPKYKEKAFQLKKSLNI